MRVVDLINRDMILPTLRSTSKNDILRELAGHLAGKIGIAEESLSKVLADREALASTAIGEGVAIPHGKIAELEKIVACVGRARDGVDFDSMDGKPTHLFIVMVAPENSTGAHLKALARISRIFKDRSFIDRLLEAATAEAMYDVLIEEDAKY